MAKQPKPALSRALQRREDRAGYLFMLPSLIFFVGFVIIPMFMCVGYSFTSTSLNSTQISFVGLQHYINLWQDPIFLKGLLNTLIIVAVSVPVTCVFSLWVSSVIYKLNNISLSAFRVIFYLPVVTGSVAVTVVWKWIYNNYFGILNSVLKSAGILETGINWLADSRTALACIIVILLTTSVGQPIVLYVSALGNVDQSLVEAAQVDGATDFQVFWKIKWAQMLPTTLYIIVITTINSFQCFALIQLLTSGGPEYATQTVMYYIYDIGIKRAGDFGYANAMGVVLAIFIGILSAIQFKLAKEK